MNKRTIFLVIGITLLAIILFLATIFSRQSKPKVNQAAVPTTIPSPTQTISQKVTQQKELDKEFSQITAKVYQLYPWLNKLPVLTNDYFVFFDPAQKKFIVNLYIPQSSVSQPTLATQRQQEVLAKLKSLGIDVSLYQFEWIIKPQ